AGAFAKGTHLPNLKRLSSLYGIKAVMSRTEHSALALARECGAEVATTDYAEILANPDVDAVLLATRHHLHAGMALAALQAGKHVLVEKPLCLSGDELQAIEDFFHADAEAKPVLLTGFNRRFSPYIRRIQELTCKRSNPMIMNYRMSAGYL